MTDCLTSYRLSTGGEAAINDRYNAFVGADHPHLRRVLASEIGTHPSEQDIVDEALEDHRQRLCDQISAAEPRVLVTLGNAAARVINHLGDLPGSGVMSLDTYGTPRALRICGRDTRWFALAHPASPPPYQEAHTKWLDRTGFLTLE
jgi:uracil-DNA glycosylase